MHLLRQAVVVQSVAGYGTSQICVFNILSRKYSWLGVLEGSVKLTECQVPEWWLTAPGGGTNRWRAWRIVTSASGCLSEALALRSQGRVTLEGPYWIWAPAGSTENIPFFGTYRQ